MKIRYWKPDKGSIPARIYITIPTGMGCLVWAEKYGINDFRLKYKAGEHCIKSKWSIECYIKDLEGLIGGVTWSYLENKAITRGEI